MQKLLMPLAILWLLFPQHLWAGTFEEGFESINDLPNQGWVFENRSDFVGDLFWSQGSPDLFTAHEGPDHSYILGGSGQTAGNVLCDWLILPDMGFVDQLNFHTRTEGLSVAPDRLAVVYSPSGSTATGPCVTNNPAHIESKALAQDFGDFQVLHMVNPNLTAGGYPAQWTEVNVPVHGSGRLALVYFVENVAQPPFNGNLIAIDSISFGPGTPQGSVSAVPTLGIWGLLLLAAGVMLSPLFSRK